MTYSSLQVMSSLIFVIIYFTYSTSNLLNLLMYLYIMKRRQIVILISSLLLNIWNQIMFTYLRSVSLW